MSEQNVRWMNMFFNTRRNNLCYEINGFDSYESGTHAVAKRKDGTLVFASTALTQTDASTYELSELSLAEKRSEKSPDFIGEHVEPKQFDGHKPRKFKVAGWWKTTKSGDPYIRCALTAI